MKLTLTDRDRCILLAALTSAPELLDAISTDAYLALQDGQPWAPHGSIRYWLQAHQDAL